MRSNSPTLTRRGWLAGAALGQTPVIEHRAGAGGTVGTHAINATRYRKLPYAPLQDLVPIGRVGFRPTLLVVASTLPIKTVAERDAEATKRCGAQVD